MTDLFHVPQSTADRWRADGRFVLFGEGEWCSCDSVPSTDNLGGHTHPPAWMAEAAKPCEACCDGWVPGYLGIADQERCLHCSNGQRRHPVTVPCPDDVVCSKCCGTGVADFGDLLPDHSFYEAIPCDQCQPPHDEWCETCDGYTDLHGRISTGLLAVVEFGPWQIVESWIGSRAAPIPAACLSHDGFLDWRWSSDDLSLVGQWAIGGRIFE